MEMGIYTIYEGFFNYHGNKTRLQIEEEIRLYYAKYVLKKIFVII